MVMQYDGRVARGSTLTAEAARNTRTEHLYSIPLLELLQVLQLYPTREGGLLEWQKAILRKR